MIGLASLSDTHLPLENMSINGDAPDHNAYDDQWMEAHKDGIPDKASIGKNEKVWEHRDQPSDEIDSLNSHVHGKFVIEMHWECGCW